MTLTQQVRASGLGLHNERGAGDPGGACGDSVEDNHLDRPFPQESLGSISSTVALLSLTFVFLSDPSSLLPAGDVPP